MEEVNNEELKGKEEILLESLLIFYKNDPKCLHMLSSISKQKTSISLREIDYTVTNYSYNNKITYVLDNGKKFNMFSDYKNQLRGYSKKCLDPFCRRQRIFIDYETMSPIHLKNDEVNLYKQRTDGIVTTIGQLNFFKWAINNQVIEFCFKNKEKIDMEMEKMCKKKEKEVKVIVQFN